MESEWNFYIVFMSAASPSEISLETYHKGQEDDNRDQKREEGSDSSSSEDRRPLVSHTFVPILASESRSDGGQP